MSNYSPDWKGLGNITEVSVEEFKKWVKDGKKKTQPFAASQENDVKPIGVGVFGNIYNQFKGKAKEAIDFLQTIKTGEALAALSHPEIGDISIVWGNKSAGLEKIINKHPEVLNNLQEIIQDMKVVQKSDNRIKLESDDYFAVVSKDYNGSQREQWLLTAYEKKKTDASGGSMDIGPEPVGKQNGTAPLQSIRSSESKGKQSSPQMQTSISEESSTKKPEPKPKVLVSDERMEELRKRLKGKLSQLTVGVDPEILAIGIEMAVYHVERGAYKFADYTKRMVADLGDVIRPYLKAFYNGARDLPEMEQNAQQMDSYADVSAIDVNFITIEESIEVSLELKRESRYNEK